MTLLKWLLSLGALAVLLLVGAYWVRPVAPLWEKQEGAGLSVPPAGQSAKLTVGAPSLPPEVEAFAQAPPVERVKEFYARESQRIGAVDPQPELTEKRLALVASLLNSQEIQWLEGQAKDPRGEGDGRFFAAYLLALSLQPEATEAVASLALSPVPSRKNQGLVELERQIRGQAVEGLGRSCASVPAARDHLLEVVARQEDEFLRDRAHRALFQCRTGKPVEEQDRQALRKVLYGG